jgi:hypothetical protein
MVTLTKELYPLDVDLLSDAINRHQLHRSHTNLRRSARSFSNEFQAPVTTDLVSPDAVCDWCGHTAELSNEFQTLVATNLAPPGTVCDRRGHT